MARIKNITIKDVAAHAGVSVGTVSRVLAKNQTVKKALFDRVNASIVELGFKPNLAARAMRAKHVNVVGLIVPDITNPFFAQLANELERFSSDHNHALILASSRNQWQHEALQLQAILEHKPKAVLIVPSDENRSIDVPDDTLVLALDRNVDGIGSICTDQMASAALALDHLIELGHRKILYIAGPENTATARQRKDGFCARVNELKDQGVDIDLRVTGGAFSFESGDQIAREVLSQPNPPTAIATASDQQAIGVIRAARDIGVVVPQQLSVIGFDDIALADIVVPRLTTIRQPVADIAKCAIDRLFDDTPADSDALFMGELIVRRTTAVVSKA
ncbi:LacI family transcriptional regulator [Pacificibacter maritimus]|uniref:LacI family transcriptional regulator n=1 Tax=Pacificibacter maritimus TaxID=762213 RepID=A0A3N4TXT2_9RHOB|nr:LacI family DNA-binding transcriptional regulator [Pacificibacter maritimus]RPE63326.1 LacI family transcriptional regulator [Pacificibacter maritimus]